MGVGAGAGVGAGTVVSSGAVAGTNGGRPLEAATPRYAPAMVIKIPSMAMAFSTDYLSSNLLTPIRAPQKMHSLTITV